jgi:CO/xanthine dehydrogenase FAD-binding subunit
MEDVHFRTSPHRATSAYRAHLSRTLLRRVVERAYGRALGMVSR